MSDPFSIEIQAEDFTILDTTGTTPANGLTVVRNASNPEPPGVAIGPDGLWDDYTGSGYMDLGTNIGDAVAFTTSVPEDGVYAITLRFSNGGASARSMAATVDGASIGNIAFPPTGSWQTWVEVTVETTLAAGSHSFRFANATSSGPNLDRAVVALVPEEVTEPGPRDTIRINFQDGATPLVAGYLADDFQGFGQRAGGLSYGWVTEASAIDADGTQATPIDPSLFPADAAVNRTGGEAAGVDARLSSVAHFDLAGYPERVAWQMAVADGWYEVTVAVGDVVLSEFAEHDMNIEGVAASHFVPDGVGKTQLVTRAVQVTDGFLTLSAEEGGGAAIQYLEIRDLPDLTPGDGAGAPADYAGFTDPRAAIQDGATVHEVDLDPGSGIAGNVDPGSDIFLGIAVGGNRGGLLIESLTDGSIRLYETLTGVAVDFEANTTAAGDSLTISPAARLKANTSYTLVIDGALDRGPNDDPDGAPREFERFTSTFVTGETHAGNDSGVAFNDVLQIDGAADGAYLYTTLTFSPDQDQIYVATMAGEILRWDLDPVSGAIVKSSREAFTPGGDFETGAGRRGIVGLAFDPGDPDTIWITDNHPIPLTGPDDSVPDFTGRVSKVSLGAGGSLENATVSTYITGLPRSIGDHVTNSLAFRANPDYDAQANPGAPRHLLYVAQGSNSATGAPDAGWGFRPERLLNGTVLEIDPTRAAPPGGFDVATEPLPQTGAGRYADADNDLRNGGIAITDGPHQGDYLHFDARGVASVRAGASADSPVVKTFYDPFAADAVLKIHATGTRNAYDLVWHSNGNLYVPTNGSAAGGATPDDPDTPANEAKSGLSLQPDWLFKVREGGYYGHPNPLHDHYILNGGNPTSGTDFGQVTDYAVGTRPEADLDLEGMYRLGNNRSPNGAAEYASDAWGAALEGALLFTEYSGGNDIRAVLFDDNGRVSRDFVLRDFDRDVINGYPDPLDLIVNPDTGQIYLLTLNRATGQSQIVRLDPAAPPVRVEAEDFTRVQGFTVANNSNASAGQMLQASGTGPQVAQNVFTGTAGLYTIGIGHFDENDGTASMVVKVNGLAVDAFLWDQQLGSGSVVNATRASHFTGGIELRAGDVVEISGRPNAGEPLRVDFVEYSFTGPVNGGADPVNHAPAAVNAAINASHAFTGAEALSISDADSGHVTATLGVQHGTLAFAAGSGATVLSHVAGQYVLAGTLAQVNDALAGASYTSSGNFLGVDMLSFQTTDGANADLETVAITVDPSGNPNADIVVDSRDPGLFNDRLHFSWIDQPMTNAPSARAMKGSAVARVSNEGTEALHISGFDLDGPFRLADPAQLTNATIAAGGFIDVRVNFDRAAFAAPGNGAPGVFSGRLRIFSDDAEDSTIAVDLGGVWQRMDEGGWEPNVNEVFEALGLGNRIAGVPYTDAGVQPLDKGGVYGAFDANEILSPYWRIADGHSAAEIIHVAQYQAPNTSEIAIHRPFAKATKAVSMTTAFGHSQMLFPNSRASVAGTEVVYEAPAMSARFTRASIPDGWQGEDVFGISVAGYSSDPFYNVVGNPPAGLAPGTVVGQWLKIFQALDANGQAIADTYVAIQDFAGSNGDYNDNVVVIRGVAPVSDAPVNTAPLQVTTDENTAFAFTGADRLSVSDADGAAMTPAVNVHLAVAHGVLNVAGGSVTIAGNGTGTVSLSGSLANVNTALGTLVYEPVPGFDGADTLRIRTNDRALTDIDAVAITVVDTLDGAPVAASVSAPDVTAGGGASTTLTVVYQDDLGLDASTIGVADISVTRAGGPALAVTGASFVASNGGRTITATYAVAAPGGTWDGLDNGAYAVAINADEVRDGIGQGVTAGTVASFDVAVPLPAPVRLQAEAMTRVQGFTLLGNSNASGGQLIQASGSGEQVARHVFSGAEGVYSLDVGYFDENDGLASMSVVVKGLVVDTWVWSQNLGSGALTPATRA